MVQSDTESIEGSAANGIPTHVQTAALIYGYGGTSPDVPLSRIVPYLTWASTSPIYAADVRAAGIKVDPYVLFYRDSASAIPNIGYEDVKPGAVDSAALAKTCRGSPITTSDPEGSYLVDPRQFATAVKLGGAVVDYSKAEYGSNYDAIYLDEVDALYGVSSTPCNFSASAWTNWTNEVDYNLHVPLWLNTLNGVMDATSHVALVLPSNVLGAVCESCYTNNNPDTSITGYFWTNREQAEIDVVRDGKTFWAYPRASGDAASEIGLRIYAYASFLLTYDPMHAMLQEAHETPSGFEVFPESGLVPEDPTATYPNITQYQWASGAYGRTFEHCYYRGVDKGECAVVVNPNTHAVTLSTSFTHSLKLEGYGVLDANEVYFSGPKVTTLEPGTAAILFI